MLEKYIVTGGAGLIGSNIVRELNSSGITDILLVDHLGKSEKWKNLRDLKFTDYLEKDKFHNSILHGTTYSEYKFIIHMGACSSTTETDASYLIENNYSFTKSLGELAITKGKRFLYASSAATYGLGENGYIESNLEKLKPLNMYGYSKHMYDLHASKNGILDKITGLKFFNVFGYGEFHKENMRSVVLKGFNQIMNEGKLDLFESHRADYRHGEQQRDFLYVKDAAKMTLHLLHTPSYGLYNIGKGRAETWNQLARALFRAMSIPECITYIPMPANLRSKYQYHTEANMDKFNNTGYKEKLWNLEDSIQDYVSLLKKDGL